MNLAAMATEGHNRKNIIEFSESIIKANFAEMFRALAATKYCFVFVAQSIESFYRLMRVVEKMSLYVV